MGRIAQSFAVDVLDEAAVSRVAGSVKRVDVLVNAYGTNVGVPTEEILLSDWERVVDTNLKGPSSPAGHSGSE